MTVELAKLRPNRVRYFACYDNDGQRVSQRPPRPYDGHLARNRADRRAAGQTRNRLFVNTSPRMRHGIDGNPRRDVMRRRALRSLARAVMAATP